MAKNIEPSLKSIGNYLKTEEDTVFVIPEYQRAYSWSVDNCDKLWQDINEFYERSKGKRAEPYFFGTIIINCMDGDKKYSLIDGQQRTTTFLLLLKALLLNINGAIRAIGVPDEESASLLNGLRERRRGIMGILYKAESEYISDVPNDEKDAEIFKDAVVLENCSINETYKDELGKILAATDYNAAEAAVIKIRYKQKDNKYTSFFRNFKFFYEKSRELTAPVLNSLTKLVMEKCEVIEIKSWDVDQAIKMFNSLNSSGLPLYDSDIISSKLYAEADSKGLREVFAGKWEQFKGLVTELEENRFDIDSILMQYMYYLRAAAGDTRTENGSVNVTTPGLRRYFTDDNKAHLSEPIRMCDDLIRLAQIWKKVIEYSKVKLLLKLSDNARLFLASYLFRFTAENITEERIDPVIDCMLRLFTLLEVGNISYSSKQFKIYLFDVQCKLVNASVTEEEIVEDFNAHINGTWNDSIVRDELLAYDKNALVYLNEYLFAREKGVEFKLGARYDVEHIMPYSGSNLQNIRTDAGIESEDEFNGIVNKLGNKIVLEERINRSIGNEWFRTKVSTRLENKTGYIDSEYPIACALVNKYRGVEKPYWTKDDIIAATEKACDRAVRFIFGG